MVKPLNIFIRKERVDNIGYCITDEELSRMHHSVKGNFDILLMDLTFEEKNLKEFLDLYSNEYKIYARVPHIMMKYILNSNTVDPNDEYFVIMDFLKRLLTYNIKGLVLEVGEYSVDSKKAFLSFQSVFLKRIIPIAVRYNKRVFVANGLRQLGEKGFSLGELIKICRDEKLEMSLNIFNAHCAEHRFMDTLMTNIFTLKGVANEFKLIVVSGITSKGKEVPASGNDGMSGMTVDKYSVVKYRNFVQVFKRGTLFFLRGDLEQCIEFKKNLKAIK